MQGRASGRCRFDAKAHGACAACAACGRCMTGARPPLASNATCAACGRSRSVTLDPSARTETRRPIRRASFGILTEQFQSDVGIVDDIAGAPRRLCACRFARRAKNKTRRAPPDRRVFRLRVDCSIDPAEFGRERLCYRATTPRCHRTRFYSGRAMRCPPGAVSNRRRTICRSRCPSRVLRSPPPRFAAAAGSPSAGPRSTVTGRACRSCSSLR